MTPRPSLLVLTLSAMSLVFSLLPSVAHSQEPAETSAIRTPEAAAELDLAAERAYVVASTSQLTLVLEALVKRAPGIRTLAIHHSASRPMELRSLELLQRLERLETLAITGDAFLYDAEFAALGKLSSVRSLRLRLP